MEITTLTPAESDTALAQLLEQIHTQRHALAVLDQKLEAAEESMLPNGNLLVWKGTGYIQVNAAEQIAEYETQIAAGRNEIARLINEKQPYEARWAAEGWQRYYLVTNGNGHVHTSTGCSTCFETTEFAWLPECSGMTEAELVEEFGERVCTVCCPTAPVTKGLVGRRDRVAQDEKEAIKSAKLAEKLEKALLPDGSALRLANGEGEPKTLIAGQRMLADQMNSLAWYGDSHPYAPHWYENIEALLTAISNKTGEDRETLRSTAWTKAQKKAAKEKGETVNLTEFLARGGVA